MKVINRARWAVNKKIKNSVVISVSDPGFFPDPDQTFFSESRFGSGSAKNPDPIRKNPVPEP